MADKSKKEPVTDSRFPGFNPEVEASKAEAEAAAAPPEPAKPEPQPKPAGVRKPLDVVNDLEARVRSVHGSHPWFEELIAELKSVL
jgi:hypothetical protein